MAAALRILAQLLETRPRHQATLPPFPDSSRNPSGPGADAVIDSINNSSSDPAEFVDFFGTTTRNLLAAEESAGVRHHVLLRDGAATIAPLLVQPIAPADVAEVLAEIAAGTPLNGTLEIAGPQTQDLVDMARRTLAVRGQDIKLIPTWRGTFGPPMAGEILLPGEGARLTPTTFEDWLAAGAR